MSEMSEKEQGRIICMGKNRPRTEKSEKKLPEKEEE
jgi:hypothetical protein